jgi:LysM repeat protein
MSLLKPAYGSILVTVIILALTLVAGNVLGGVQAGAVRAPAVAQEATPQPELAQPTQSPIGEVSGTSLPGDKVRVTQGEVLIGETVAASDGTWRVPIQKSASAITPYHVKIVPSAQRGAADVPEGPVTILVSVVVGLSRVEVHVLVVTPDTQVEVEVLTPINPQCESQGAGAQPTPQAEGQPAYHQVRAGETLAGIAGKYGTTTQALMQANKLRNANLIYVGQRLVIPAR